MATSFSHFNDEHRPLPRDPPEDCELLQQHLQHEDCSILKPVANEARELDLAAALLRSREVGPTKDLSVDESAAGQENQSHTTSPTGLMSISCSM